MHTGLWWGNLNDRGCLDDLDVNGMVILKWIFEKWDGGTEWVVLAQVGNRWRNILNVVMQFMGHAIRGSLGLVGFLLASEQLLCPKEFIASRCQYGWLRYVTFT
jgi:hypothetical protein